MYFFAHMALKHIVSMRFSDGSGKSECGLYSGTEVVYHHTALNDRISPRRVCKNCRKSVLKRIEDPIDTT